MARTSYYSLIRSSKKKKFRHNWENTIKKFARVTKRKNDPKADDATFMIGELYRMLYTYSRVKNDLTRANTRLADVSRRRFERDHFIFREHEPGERAYIIAEGSVEILKESAEGLVSLRVLNVGAMFGELALILST